MARILLCEDEETVRKELSRIIEPLNHEVDLAEDGSEALTLLGKNKYDLFISDLVVPGHSGLDLLGHLRNHRISLPVIICSAFLTQDIKRELLRYSDVTLVEKPFRPETLLTAINKFLKEVYPS
ncbi:MAG: response regulator [Planctomycetota bacterium]|nr:response regulator [Planctomycetota bacterium]